MAISRMNMERQLRNMGGIMTLDEPRQGYFLGKIVKKAKRAIKKVVKSPLGKAAILGGLGFGLGGAKFLGGQGIFAGGQGLQRFKNLANLVRVKGIGGAAQGKRGALAGLFFDDDDKFSLGRTALTGLGATAIAAPFLMGDEEPEEPEESFTGPISSIESIRQQARDYYKDPTNSALYFMPQQQFTRPFAGGGLADIPRGGYEDGESVIDLSKDPNYKGWLKLYEKNPDAAEMNENHAKYLSYYNSSKNQKAEGGIMDLGGMEKDYREGGFVPIGAEERADDVPARLSKNEFVFTADAVRNAGGGDIDKGAEVMQNMMDNLEAGGMISEESQGKENPAQAMFDQAQMLESRIV